MLDFNKARINMVDCQIRPNDVTRPNVLKAFLTVPREGFVAENQKPLAYCDGDLPLEGEGTDRFLMNAMSFSRLVQLANVQHSDIVLDIGCATGYSTAILSQLCASVVALESDSVLAGMAGQNLAECGYDNTVVVSGALEKGYAKEGPYDVIFIGGAVDEVPETLFEQLKEGGRLVVVEGEGNCGKARLYQKHQGAMNGATVFNCSVVKLTNFNKAADFVF